MQVLSKITTHRWRSISRACSLWDMRFPITPTIAKKPSRHSLPFHRRLVPHRQRRWMLATLAPQPWPPVPSAELSHTSPQAVIPIIRVGSSVLLHYLILHPRTRAPKYKWRTSSKLPWAKQSTEHANVPSNPSSGSSKRCWASASSCCVGPLQRLASGVWSVWPSISNVFTPSPGRKTGNTGTNDICPPHDRPYSASEEAPFRRFCPCQEELVCGRCGWHDCCFVLSDRLLAGATSGAGCVVDAGFFGVARMVGAELRACSAS